MKAIVAIGFMTVAFAVGALVAQVDFANADSSPRTEWQYQCFVASDVANVTKRANGMGEQGWELVTSAGTKDSTLWCFKRPLWKK